MSTKKIGDYLDTSSDSEISLGIISDADTRESIHVRDE